MKLLLLTTGIDFVDSDGKAKAFGAIALLPSGSALTEFWWPAVASGLDDSMYRHNPTIGQQLRGPVHIRYPH